MEIKDEPNNGDNASALTPSELIKKHISDPKHVISDKELANLKIGSEAEGKEALDEAVKEKLEEDGLDEGHENNSYDVLDA